MRKNKDISSDPTYWLNYATFLMSTLNRPDDARALLQRATQSLPTHQHTHIISRFGALEYSSPNGDIERGRTIFEGLVDAHKNGHDLWDQYVAQAKRAKFVFKKWLQWEKQMIEQGKGSDKNLAKVK